eukprot:80437-Pyramimonas_sp.AAC.1
MVFASSPVRVRWPFEASSWLQAGPKRASRGAQRGSRTVQHSAQERPKRASTGDVSGSQGVGLPN